ncbi:MAG: ParB/RepB/Spo0J family partition protein [Candidatus Cloacimonetes bacterium]|nr:ParB/RepB/Spo0J family partition protein [Candidatus Cloacimonadota bacterium]
MSRDSLGKGLEALFAAGPESTDRTTGITTLKVDSILPNRYQPRKVFNAEKLAELAESLRRNGILQPVIVTRNADSKYELVAGERRLEAAKIAGFTEIPVIIRSISPREQLQFAIIENIQREDLNAIEEASAYQRLNEEFGLTHVQISEIVGKERTTVSNCIRILKLSPAIQQMIMEGKLTSGHARAILQVPEGMQEDFAARIVNEGFTVRIAELEARKIATGGKVVKKKPKKDKSELISKYEKELREKLSIKINIIDENSKGRISIFYKDRKELEKILEILRNSYE